MKGQKNCNFSQYDGLYVARNFCYFCWKSDYDIVGDNVVTLKDMETVYS